MRRSGKIAGSGEGHRYNDVSGTYIDDNASSLVSFCGHLEICLPIAQTMSERKERAEESDQ
jgi:hypothetical protein